MIKPILMALAAAGLAGLSNAATASQLYSQPYNGSNYVASSQNDTGGGNGHFATVYDDFTLVQTARITEVSFAGGFINPGTPSTITSFTIGFYANNNGTPGALLQSFSVAGNGGETSLGTIGGVPLFTYAVPVDFNVTAATSYWLSIVPDLVFPPQWGLAASSIGNANAKQDFLGVRNDKNYNVAFTLTGVATGVPEPSIWLLLIGGFGAVGFVARRRRIATAGSGRTSSLPIG